MADIQDTANELVKWLKENVGDDIQIITPQFHRQGELAYKWKPQNAGQFHKFIKTAPWNILKGCGFGKWDTMNNCIKDNSPKPVTQKLKIPIVNAPRENYTIDIGRGYAPTELLEVDEDIILFPGEWYNCIPDNFIVTGLYGESYLFILGESDDDIRFGCLAYGIRRPIVKALQEKGN